MVAIPDSIWLRTLRQGLTLYYKDENFPEKPHYFVLLNKEIVDNQPLYLINASSNLALHQMQIDKGYFSGNTFVFTDTSECSFLTKPTVFDCNTIHSRPIKYILNLLSTRQIQKMNLLPDIVFRKIVSGINNSPLVSEAIKNSVT